jgi:hypothetical protein
LANNASEPVVSGEAGIHEGGAGMRGDASRRCRPVTDPGFRLAFAGVTMRAALAEQPNLA